MDKSNVGDHQDLAYAFDVVPACLAFFDLNGELHFANRAITQLWSGSPDGAMLRAVVEGFAYLTGYRIRAESTSSEGRVVEVGTREVRLPSGGTCRVRASYIAPSLFGRGSTVLISAECTPADSLPDEALSQRFGLTAREIHVARLLAEGKSNAQVAADMYISPHTARTHTERVLQKLGARSRAEVGPILRRR